MHALKPRKALRTCRRSLRGCRRDGGRGPHDKSPGAHGFAACVPRRLAQALLWTGRGAGAQHCCAGSGAASAAEAAALLCQLHGGHLHGGMHWVCTIVYSRGLLRWTAVLVCCMCERRCKEFQPTLAACGAKSACMCSATRNHAHLCWCALRLSAFLIRASMRCACKYPAE